jgi:hypothetical protein
MPRLLLTQKLPLTPRPLRTLLPGLLRKRLLLIGLLRTLLLEPPLSKPLRKPKPEMTWPGFQ